MKKSARPPAPPKRGKAAPRVRRDAADAQRIILEAAERVFAKQSPDVVGLKDVAREAGVSHALVSHYFKTYDGLVEAALERRMTMLRQNVFAELVATSDDGAPRVRVRELLGKLASVASDPVTLRLGAWALLSGRLHSDQFFAGRVQGLRQVADAVEARLRATGRTRTPRADLEFVLMAALALTYGYAIAGAPLHAGLGRSATSEANEDFRTRVVEMLDLYLSRRR
jgi:AcrR family transcriptional regulator